MSESLTATDNTLDTSVLPENAVIAIDGPAGSGKSTTAKILAEMFGLLYIDTGAMYRALTQAALADNVDLNDEKSLQKMLLEANLELKPAQGGVTVLWNDLDVSEQIRTPEVDSAVSQVSSHALVRSEMVKRQQEMGRNTGVVMEGRDIGSVVFPLATAKIFLSASLEARVERRFQQYLQLGREVDRQELTRDLAERDRQDSERETSPLSISPDSLVIDSSNMTLDQQNLACAKACLVNPTLDLDLDTDLATALGELKPWYRVAYFVFNSLARLFGLKQHGNEGKAIPRGVIIASNHVSNMDPPLVGSTFHRQGVHALAKEELFRIWPLGPLFRAVDVIPIRRRGYDKSAFKAANESLENGENLLIFPEGTRRAIGYPGPVRNGLGIMVQGTRAPILPVFIRGSYGKKIGGGSRLSPLEVSYGPVIRWHGLEKLLETIDKKEVSRRIASLCEAAFVEMQARSFARFPQTEFEKKLGEKQLVSFSRRHQKLFGKKG